MLASPASRRRLTNPPPARRLSGWGALVLLLLSLAAAPLATHAQENSQTHYVGQRSFTIPFNLGSDRQQIAELRLYLWDSANHRWALLTRAVPGTSPDRDVFDVHLDRDGMYVFAGQTVYRNGNAEPPLAQLQTMQRIIVDTERPTITLKPLPVNQQGVVGLEWEIRDDNLDLTSIRLDYRGPGQPTWARLPIEHTPQATDRAGWTLARGQRLEVRLTARDLAGNSSSETAFIGDGSGTAGSNLGTSGVGLPRSGSDVSNGAASGRRSIRYVKTRGIKLEFNIDGIGPSGLDSKDPVKLYVTAEDRRWRPVDGAIAQVDRTPDNPNTAKARIEYTVEKEGLYGFTAVAKSGVGMSGPAPQPGEEPGMWVEVDLTKPKVEGVDVKLSQNPGIRSVTIYWKASDKNFTASPINLDYSLTNTSPNWVPIEGATNLPNTGAWTWSVPAAGPHKFFVRVRATDRAGNEGEAVSNQVIVDLSRPRVNITNAEPGGGAVGGFIPPGL